jgi:hypothetical protein
MKQRRLASVMFGTAALLCAIALPCGHALADPIPGLFNTGVDDSGAPRADNDVESHYQMVAPSNVEGAPFVTTSAGGFPIGPWLDDNDLSAWITPAEDANGPGDNDGSSSYYYETTFDLTGFVPATAQISGQWSSDNLGLDILLNGVSTGFTNPAQFGEWTEFSLSGDNGDPFVAGLNTLSFVTNNGGGEDPPDGPTGVRVEMTGSAVMVPEPSTLALCGLAMLAAVVGLWRKRTA